MSPTRVDETPFQSRHDALPIDWLIDWLIDWRVQNTCGAGQFPIVVKR